MSISPKRQKKYARAAERNRRRTEIRRERRKKRSAAKPKFLENNLTEKDIEEIKTAQAMVRHYATQPEFAQPKSLPGFMACITKLKSFFAKEVPHIRAEVTPDKVIEHYRTAVGSKAKFLFHALDLELRIIEREAHGITMKTAYALIKEVWMPKKS